ncbi:RND transporter, HAE1/HME family, permease protein [Novosphingobium resinovorum]|uniref:RND transporter, HAE1/HME family, permease protein n=1 Tax=Novosphingobium resinovorum TaxID=158500 RepID=A0A031JSB9_9SPHN|nr:efflux RND transporter permease subunit [Novosphingobium resinovorum]EZP79262.1 RND transporter, HAE1/HME family, permease protein [Novosphingobium resinovorum]
MSLSAAFINRRVGTCLLAIGVVLLGLVAYLSLPISSMPQVEYPTISISASLPGASADTMATSVATPLERTLTNIPGVTQMTSSSSLGQTQITLQFDLNRNIDGAAVDVQTQINAAAGLLPKNMPNPPTYHKVNPAGASIYSLALTSDTLPLTEVDRYAENYIAQPISQLPGVGLVDYHGQLRPAVRVRVDPDRLTGLDLTLEDVRTVIGTSTVNAPKGTLNGLHQSVVLSATDQLMDAKAYRNVVVAYRNGAPIHLTDVATVENAPEDVHQAAWFQGKRAIIVDIAQSPGSNVMSTLKGIKDKLPALEASLPPSVHLAVVADRTQTITGSVNDVQLTLMITIALVVMVILVFLRNFWATLIPSLTIPLSLIATFAVMYALGYSLDNLSLMGLTIAVGFVVDDAIVVIENIMRHIEEGKSPMEAALLGSREVGFTIISMTVSLIAVFIPILAMGGLIGRLFREFAVTITVALIASGIVSLTVTPMLCGWLIRDEKGRRHGRFHRWSERWLTALNDGYERLLDVALRHQRLTVLSFVATVALTGGLYVTLPKGFFPQVDTSFVIGTIRGAPDISYEDISKRLNAVAKVTMADPDVDTVDYWAGPNPTMSDGRMILNLKPLDQRSVTADDILARLGKKIAEIPGVTQGLQVRQDIQIGARSGLAQYQYTLQDGNLPELYKWATILQDKFKTLPELQDVSSDKQASSTSMTLEIDRTTASRLGVQAQDIDNTLYDAFGQRQVATIFDPLSQYYVIEEVDPRFQLDADALTHLHVRSSTTQALVPLSSLVRVKQGVAPVTIAHQGPFPAVTLSFNLAPGVALGTAVTAIQNAEQAAGMPATVKGSFQGAAQAFQASLSTQPFLILAAIVTIYIVLGVLYESAIHPLTIISTLPSAGLGALLALMLAGKDLSIMGIIGILLLIGIVKKNAIMMIDFALHAQRERGLAAFDAIREACLLRFRPILMTTLAALLGAVPLAIGSGAGAELRQPLGIAIVGGLIVSQVLTLFTTPVIFLWFERLRVSGRRWRARKQGEGAPAQA